MLNKSLLLLSFDDYKRLGGFTLPQLNDEDLDAGITQGQKYADWAGYTQIQLNAVLQDKLDDIDYKLDEIQEAYQRSIVNILTTRLNRAFYNDELLPRDSQVSFSQQGGQSYNSSPTIDPKNSAYSFFNGPERLLIETSGLLQTTFSIDDDDEVVDIENNQFMDGPFVNKLNWSDKADNFMVFEGNNVSLEQAIILLNQNKLNTADLKQAIIDNTGLTTEVANNMIAVTQNKYIEYTAFRANKGANELAQMEDVISASAALRADIVTNQKAIGKNAAGLNSAVERIDALEAVEFVNSIVDEQEHAVVGDANQATFDLTTIQQDDGNGGQIQKFTDFSATNKWLIELYDPTTQAHQAHEFHRDKSGTYVFPNGNSSDSFKVTINDAGLVTIDRTNGNTSTATLMITEIGQIGDIALSQEQIALINTKVKKQLIQGAQADFETHAELQALLNDDDATNLTLASGIKLSGRVKDSGANPGDPIIVTGISEENNDIKFGTFSIDDQFNVTGGYVPAAVDLSNVNLGVANAGKTLEVAPDGKVILVASHSGGVSTTNIKYDEGERLFAKPGSKKETKLKALITAGKAELFLEDGDTIVGGTTPGKIKGSIPATTATQAGHNHAVGAIKFDGNESGIKGNTSGTTTDYSVSTNSVAPAITIHQSVAHNTNGEVKASGQKTFAVQITADVTYGEYDAL